MYFHGNSTDSLHSLRGSDHKTLIKHCRRHVCHWTKMFVPGLTAALFLDFIEYIQEFMKAAGSRND